MRNLMWLLLTFCLICVAPDQSTAGPPVYTTVLLSTSQPVSVDGDLSDWTDVGAPVQWLTTWMKSRLGREDPFGVGKFSGPQDLAANFRAFADQDYLYMAVDVTDDQIVFKREALDEFWWDDAVQIYLDGDLANPGGRYDANDSLIEITRSPDKDLILGGQIYQQGVRVRVPYLWESVGVQAALREREGGYTGVILPTHLVADEAPFPSEQQFRVWQDSITKGNFKVMYETSYKLYRLPSKPWPESARKLLLTIIEKYDEFETAITEGKPIDWTGKPVDLGHYLGDLVEMATWQADSRFVPFLAESLGGGTLPARGLAAIGEPAFDMVIQELHRDGWSSQRGAAKALELMLKADLPFLRAGAKRDRARGSLLRVARSKYYLSRKRSIDALRYFNDKAVFALLDSLSQHDMYTIDGRYPVRKQAQEAMQFMRSRGDDRQ